MLRLEREPQADDVLPPSMNGDHRIGGHVHVGLEMYEGDRQPTNLELVEEVVALCREIGRPTMRWYEVPSILGFPSRG